MRPVSWHAFIGHPPKQECAEFIPLLYGEFIELFIH